MPSQTLLYIVLAASAAVVAYAVVITLSQVRNSIAALEKRLDESLRQVEMTAEDLRKTNVVLRDILTNVDRGTANIAHLTDGIRRFRGTVDAASSVLDQAILPLFGTVGSVIAGLKAGVGHLVNRIASKGRTS